MESFTVQQFDGTNWFSWKKGITVLLLHNRCWSFIEGKEEPPGENASWQEVADYQARKTKAYTYLYNAIRPDLRSLIDGTLDGREAWKLLLKQYEPQTRARKAQLLDKFYETKYIPGEDLGLFLSRVKAAAKCVEDAGHQLDPLSKGFQFIRSLPEQYNSVSQQIYKWPDSDFIPSKIEEELLAERSRIEQAERDRAKTDIACYSSTPQNSTNVPVQGNRECGKPVKREGKKTFLRQMRCFRCGVYGHLVKDCTSQSVNQRTKNKTFKKQTVSTNEVHSCDKQCCNLECDKNTWAVDTAATDHFTNNKAIIQYFKPLKNIQLKLAAGVVEFEPLSGDYYPILYANDYWNLIRDYTPINDSVKSLPLHLTFQPLSLFRWQLYTAQAMRSRWTSFLGQDLMEESDEDQDYMKEALLETSPILLGLTFVVSIVHSIFEFLAFKNDIQFWNNRKSLEGLSVRSVFFNVFQSIVVLLYVLDNDTNMVVRISVFVGLLIEVWKIHKVTNIEIDHEQKWFGVIPKIKLTDKGSYVQSSTKEYDVLAFRYLSWALFPLLGCYAVYSLLYLEHKGWYSWVLSMLYGFLLTFGFIMMTPQLFINYKLKSVAHLPWRMLSYKFLNTFIDDIFAFVIKMPTMYRLGCFRDDIVFFIYLYQRWIYRVDPKRMNEFGTCGEMETQQSEANGVVCTDSEEKPIEAKKED